MASRRNGTVAYFSVNDVAKMLDVKPKTIRRRVADGSIRAVRLSSNPRGRLRISADAVREFVESNRA
jgi:excisionase family DNA binding protein